MQSQTWVKVEDILKWIENLRKSNDMWRYSADECLSMLEDELTTSLKTKGESNDKTSRNSVQK